ncbi:MAG: hypothetical protein ACFBWO_13720 [Paracoccaceae bacterium]
MKIIRLVLLALAGTTLVQGCATVTRGTSDEVVFLSDPGGAEVETSLGHRCTTPCTLTIGRKSSFQATFRHDDEERVVNVATRVSGEGAVGMAGNVLVGGLIGIGVDAISGATLEHDPNPVRVAFDDPAPRTPGGVIAPPVAPAVEEGTAAVVTAMDAPRETAAAPAVAASQAASLLEGARYAAFTEAQIADYCTQDWTTRTNREGRTEYNPCHERSAFR